MRPAFRVPGKTQWLHVICFRDPPEPFRVSSRRGRSSDRGLRLVVHDHWARISRCEGVQHALVANAHHLRELQALNRWD